MDPTSVLQLVREQNRYIYDSFNSHVTAKDTADSHTEDFYFNRSFSHYPTKNGTDKSDTNPYEKKISLIKNYRNQSPAIDKAPDKCSNSNSTKSNASTTNMTLQKQHALKSSSASSLNFSFSHQKDSQSRSASVKSVASDSGVGSASPLSDCSDIPAVTNNPSSSQNFHRITKVPNDMSQPQQRAIQQQSQHYLQSTNPNDPLKSGEEYQKMMMLHYQSSPIFNKILYTNQDHPAPSFKRKLADLPKESTNTQRQVIYNSQYTTNAYNRMTPTHQQQQQQLQQGIYSEYSSNYVKPSLTASPANNMHSHELFYKANKPMSIPNHPDSFRGYNGASTSQSSEILHASLHTNHQQQHYPGKSTPAESPQSSLNPMYSKSVDYSNYPQHQQYYQQLHHHQQQQQQQNHHHQQQQHYPQAYHQQLYQQQLYQQQQKSYTEQDKKAQKIIQPIHQTNKANTFTVADQRYMSANGLTPVTSTHQSFSNTSEKTRAYPLCGCSYPECEYNKMNQTRTASALPLANHSAQHNSQYPLTAQTYSDSIEKVGMNLTRLPVHGVKPNQSLPIPVYARERHDQSHQYFYNNYASPSHLEQHQYPQRMSPQEQFHTSQTKKKESTQIPRISQAPINKKNLNNNGPLIYNNQPYNNRLQLNTIQKHAPSAASLLPRKVSPQNEKNLYQPDHHQNEIFKKSRVDSGDYIVINDSETAEPPVKVHPMQIKASMSKFKRPRIYESSQENVTTIPTPNGENLKLKRLPNNIKQLQQTRKLIEKYKNQRRMELKLKGMARQYTEEEVINKSEPLVKKEDRIYAHNFNLIKQAKSNIQQKPAQVSRTSHSSESISSNESNSSSSSSSGAQQKGKPLVIAPISSNNKKLSKSIVCLGVNSGEYDNDIELGEIVQIEKIKNRAAFDFINSSSNDAVPVTTQNQATRYDLNMTEKNELTEENIKEPIEKPVTLSKKILPIVTPRIQEWLEKCAEFVNETSLTKSNKMDLGKLLRLLDITWPRLLITFMIENNFSFFVTKDSHQIARMQAKQAEIESLAEDQVKERAQLELELIAIDKSLPKEKDAIQLHNIIMKGNEFNLNSRQFDELRRLILFKEGSKENARFHEMYLESQRKLHTVLETTHNSNVFPKFLLFLPSIYGIKTEVIENLFCSNFNDSKNVRDLFRKRFEVMLKV